MPSRERPTERVLKVYLYCVDEIAGAESGEPSRFEWEDLIGLGNRVFESICALDMTWHEDDGEDAHHHDPSMVSTIERHYRDWTSASLDLLDRLDRSGGEYKGTDVLRDHVEIASAIVPPAPVPSIAATAVHPNETVYYSRLAG